MPDEHENVVTLASRGDVLAIDSLLVRHLPALRAYVRLQAGEAIRMKESISDLAQSVCREVLEDLDRFDYRGEAAFKHWLFTKAMHKIRDRVKFYNAAKRKVGREIDRAGADDQDVSYADQYADLVTPSRIVGGREALAQVEKLCDELPEDHREVIVLSRIVGLSHAEIGERMGRSESAARQLLHRALVRLSGLLRNRLKWTD